MQPSGKIGEYVKTVCEQIRWKKAHAVIAREIENHIIDQKNAFISQGYDEETATEKAVKEMGDPILVGSEFDRTHRPKIEWSLISLIFITLLIGFLIRMFLTYDLYRPETLVHSILITLLGIGGMTAGYLLDFTIIAKYSKRIYFGLIAIVIGIVIAFPVVNGRGYFYTQFILLLFPTVFAGVIYNMRTKGYLGIILSSLYLAVPAFIGLTITSFSSVFLYLFTSLILLTFAVANGSFTVRKLRALLIIYISFVMTAMSMIFIAIVNHPYRLLRLQNAINPSLDPMGSGYIGIITRDMITKAKFFGQNELGINSGNILPNISTDYLLTYLIHRFGWVSFVVLMTVILAFVIRSLLLSLKQKSVLGKLISTSVLMTFTMQVALYVVSNLGYPLFSLTLPLISYGGTATIINMTLIGFMLSVFKSGDLVRDNLLASTWSERS